MSLLFFFLAFNNTLIDSTKDSIVVTSAEIRSQRREGPKSRGREGDGPRAGMPATFSELWRP